MKQCSDCHGGQVSIHAGSSVATTFEDGKHARLACQVCHIPAIARAISTKTEWYWSDAGQDIDPVPVDTATGRPTYDKKKGTFVWANDVRPTLRYSNGTWKRKVIGVNDKYDEEPIALGDPVGDYNDPEAMIYPFKLMIGNQPVDPETRTVLVPHLFGMAGGPNPYWGKYDWAAALADGAAYTGRTTVVRTSLPTPPCCCQSTMKSRRKRRRLAWAAYRVDAWTATPTIPSTGRRSAGLPIH